MKSRFLFALPWLAMGGLLVADVVVLDRTGSRKVFVLVVAGYTAQ